MQILKFRLLKIKRILCFKKNSYFLKRSKKNSNKMLKFKDQETTRFFLKHQNFKTNNREASPKKIWIDFTSMLLKEKRNFNVITKLEKDKNRLLNSSISIKSRKSDAVIF